METELLKVVGDFRALGLWRHWGTLGAWHHQQPLPRKPNRELGLHTSCHVSPGPALSPEEQPSWAPFPSTLQLSCPFEAPGL